MGVHVTVRVLIADDHTMVREGLVRAMEQAGFEVVDQAGDGEAAVEKATEHRPDVVLMDLSLPVLSGAAATRRIRRQLPETAVLVLSMLSDETAVSSALEAGANGYMVKDCLTAEVVEAVSRVANGELVLSTSIAAPGDGSPTLNCAGGSQHAIPFNPAPGSARPLLSKREEEVLRMMATGVSITEAASRLYISVKTVKNHLSSIYEKLSCHDRAQAVLRALRMGLIQLD
jgi:DNA-binding NarL/FixJ family response regulator